MCFYLSSLSQIWPEGLSIKKQKVELVEDGLDGQRSPGSVKPAEKQTNIKHNLNYISLLFCIFVVFVSIIAISEAL